MMTDVVSHPAPLIAAPPIAASSMAAPRAGARAGRPVVWRASLWQPALALIVAAAALAGWLLSAGATSPALLDSDAELATLLRFMAVVKAVMALAALVLTAWRLGHPATPAAASLYVAGAALMATGPGVIWHLDHVAIGAALFHAGLLTWLTALVADRSGVTGIIRHALQRDRVA